MSEVALWLWLDTAELHTMDDNVLYLTKTLVVETSHIAIIALVLLRECSPSLLLINR